MPDPLTRAAIRYGSDKFGGHLYTPIYHELFSHLRELKIKFLEIGIGGYNIPKAGGASLRMWAEYFPYAQIVGLDIELKELDISPRVKIVRGSQVDFTLLEDVVETHGPFDIVVDDGSHIVSHVKDTFSFLYPLIAPTGIYVIEDTQTAFTAQFGGNRTGDGTIFTLAQRIALAMHRREGFSSELVDPADQLGAITKSVAIYRNQIVFHRGANTYPSNDHMDFEDREVREIYAIIGKEGNLNPSSGSFVSRIDMAIRSGQHAEAVKLALKASQIFPSNINLHYELIRMMEWAGQPEVMSVLAERLLA